MEYKDLETFYPKNIEEWRNWLIEHHVCKQSIWVIFYKKSSNIPTITWSESVDEALCFGWIDSVIKKLDENRSIQYFSKRKANSTWSKVNKEKIEVLLKSNKMMPSGLESIEIAKQNRSWTILDEVEAFIIPKDLDEAFELYPGSKDFFVSLSKTTRKQMLQWIVLARQQETRNRRIVEIASLASIGQKPKLF